MNVLVVSNLYPPDFLGGYELGCRQMADALAAAGHRVTVLTANPRNPVAPQPGVLRRLRLVDVYDPHTQQATAPAGLAGRQVEANAVQPANVHAFLDVLADVQPDVVYFWNLFGVGGLGLLAAAEFLGVPWVMHVMDAVPKVLCSLPGGAAAAAGRAYARLLGGRYLCCSQTVLDEIVGGGVAIGDRAAVVPNWVTGAGSPGRTAYAPGGRLRVAYAGALSADKGVDILIRAAGRVRDAGPADFTLDVYGRVTDPHFPALVQRLGLGDRVRLCGVRPQAELAAGYPNYDVFAFPTAEREPMAFAPMEAAAHGCVMLLPRVCGNSEWFLDRVDCVKADRTPDGFAAALEDLATGAVSAAAVGRRGMATVLGRFHLDRVRPRVEAELAAAAADRRPARGTPADVYRMAVLADKTFHGLVQQAYAA